MNKLYYINCIKSIVFKNTSAYAATWKILNEENYETLNYAYIHIKETMDIIDEKR